MPRRYVNPERRDWLVTFGWVGLYVAVMTIAFILYWLLGFVVAFAGLVALIAWHHRTVAYRCLHCDEVFEISFVVDLISPHGIDRGGGRQWRGWKYLRCPHCGRRSRATAMIVVDD